LSHALHAQKIGFACKDLPGLWETVRLAQKMAEYLE
jgi:hypothetical protein